MNQDQRNITLLFTTRIIRLFAYGFLSIVLALYLAKTGLTETQIGLLFTGTLIGDAIITLAITTVADRIGRRKMLILGALLMILAGIVFALTRNYLLLLLAAVIGVISPSGNEIGPFLSMEQAGLTQLIPNERRTQIFAWYNLAGSFATAVGALSGGWLTQFLRSNGWSALAAYQTVILGYALAGVILILLFILLSPAVEVKTNQAAPQIVVQGRGLNLGLHQSRKIVFKLSALFALDAFAGGFVIQSLLVYWFHRRFGLDTGVLGSIFFGANILAGISALLAARIAARIGLIKTMVYTHIPSNILLCLVPLMPGAGLAITMLLLRFSISQMDVPTRQSYTMAVVSPDERSAASGVTAIARSIGASASPALAGLLLATTWLLNAPLLIAGGLKIIYDLILYRSFQTIKPPEEHKTEPSS
ncbi:MAG TPA: MFS transporter [Bacillota bacterium]|nr:MFS transporter [Bacillota bacterium]